MATKQQLINKLKQKMLNDKSLPLQDTATNLVFGEGSLNPKIYFLGEAPGKYEDLSGRPFVGKAGKLLENLLTQINLTRKEVYITSVLRYRPPNNRDPKPSEIKAFTSYLNEEINIIRPKIIATLGRFSLNHFLQNEKISQIHGQVTPIKFMKLDILIFPLYHPAAALRQKIFSDILNEDFLKLKTILNNDS